MTQFLLPRHLRTARYRRLLSAAALAMGIGSAGTARAQAQDRISLGAGAVVVPAIFGSDKVHVLPMPMIDVKQGRLFANFLDGAGVYVLDTPKIQIGGSVMFVRGYRDEDVPNGVDGLSNTAGGRGFIRYRSGLTAFTLGATRSIGGTKGTTIDARITHIIPVGKLTLIPMATLTWGDAVSQRNYFGISARESAASGIAAYSPSSGLRDVTLAVSANYRLSPRLNLTGSVGATTLTDNSLRSPLAEQRTTPIGMIGLSRAF